MPDSKKKKKLKQKDEPKAEVKPDEPDQTRLRRIFPEFARLPDGWVIKTWKKDDKNNGRVYYAKEGENNAWIHPSLGALPAGWQIRLWPQEGTGLLEPKFSIKQKNKWRTSLKDPRLDPKVLKASQKELVRNNGSGNIGEKSSMQIAGSLIKMSKKKKLDDMRRADISKVDISGAYDYLHCIDSGGDIGAMNGGVFVVRLKKTSQLYVEKRFLMDDASDRQMAINELKLMHQVKHPALTFFSNGFITREISAVYMELCDRGSLEDIMSAYKDMRKKSSPDERPRMPEKFLWHCFVGLCDALAYLQTGLHYLGKNIQSPDKIASGWVPILHRDIKPDNILLKSRSQSAERKYFYCTLSDFGLACEDYPDDNPKQDYYQRTGAAAGTPYWFAPEMCYGPYPKTMDLKKKFAGKSRHSKRTDLWALGTIIYNLAECNSLAHVDWAQKDAYNIHQDLFPLSKVMHVEPKTIKLYYSKELRDCVKEATNPDPNKRPKASEMVIKLAKMAKKALKGADINPQNEEERLPSWATGVHEYHAKKPKTREEVIAEKKARTAAGKK